MSKQVRRLKGTVEKVTMRRLKDGRVRHWTRIRFYPDRDGHPFKGVTYSGVLPADDPEGVLLVAIREKDDVPGLPKITWSKDSR